MANGHKVRFWQEKIISRWPIESITLHTGEIHHLLRSNFTYAPSMNVLVNVLHQSQMIKKVGAVKVYELNQGEGSHGRRANWSIDWEYAAP